MATSQPDTEPSPAAIGHGRELVLAVVGAHAGSLLALARRYSLCADDAHDAYQRALEIFLRRADSVDPARAAAWLRTVVKHEALAVRESRQRIVGPAEVDLDRAEARDLLPVDERAAAAERDGRSAEALARLKPQEVRALVLKAHGYSYREISEITGWSHTKVNRCLTEGRRAFLKRFADIEAGRECGRWAGVLSALADGEASPSDVAAVRPHLRHCPPCRARLREFRTAPRAVAAIAPMAAILQAGDGAHGAGFAAADHEAAPGLLARAHDAVVAGWHERVLLSAHKVQAAVEAASAGKVAAVAASATALAGGGAAALTSAAESPLPARPAAAVSTAEPEKAPEPARRGPVASVPDGREPPPGEPASESGRSTDGGGPARAEAPAARPSEEFDVSAAPPAKPPSRADAPAAPPDAPATASAAQTRPSRPARRPASGVQPEFGP